MQNSWGHPQLASRKLLAGSIFCSDCAPSDEPAATRRRPWRRGASREGGAQGGGGWSAQARKAARVGGSRRRRFIGAQLAVLSTEAKACRRRTPAESWPSTRRRQPGSDGPRRPGRAGLGRATHGLGLVGCGLRSTCGRRRS
jgi:hypothetical protein